MNYYKTFIRGSHASVAGVLDMLITDGVAFSYRKNPTSQGVIIINETETHKLPTDQQGFYLPSIDNSGYSITVLDKNSLDFLVKMGFNVSEDEL